MTDSIRAAVIHTTGRVESIHLDSKTIAQQLQTIVGGNTEAVVAKTDKDGAALAMGYVNRGGKELGQNVNDLATRMLANSLDSSLAIVGPMVVVGPPDEDGNDTSIPHGVLYELREMAADAGIEREAGPQL